MSHTSICVAAPLANAQAPLARGLIRVPPSKHPV